FFQAEDGIRYRNVTGVQTCALPISVPRYSIASRKTRSPSTRSISGPRKAPGRTNPSWSTAAGRNTPLRGTSQVKTPGTDARSVQIGRASCRERVESVGGGGQRERAQ